MGQAHHVEKVLGREISVFWKLKCKRTMLWKLITNNNSYQRFWVKCRNLHHTFSMMPNSIKSEVDSISNNIWKNHRKFWLFSNSKHFKTKDALLLILATNLEEVKNILFLESVKGSLMMTENGMIASWTGMLLKP